MEQLQPARGRVWVGVDVGKGAHHAAAVDGEGRLVWSRRVANDQAAIQGLIGQATASSAAGVGWAVDSTGGSSTLLLALLVAADHRSSMCLAGWSTGWPGRSLGRPRPTPRTRW